MDKRPRTFIAAVALSGAALAAGAQTPLAESGLLAEPMWLLQDADGGASQVWFERRNGSLHLVRCVTDPRCIRPAAISAGGVRVQGLAETITVWPALPAGSLILVPSWVVPVSSHNPGH